MRKRVLSFLLAASAAFCFMFSSAPEAHAIVPIGLVQSALASYVTSTGYKMWSENGGGELMVEALSTLYQSWLDSTDPVGALTLGEMSENDYVYLDNSGQIVIRKAAADMFQQFSDWIQTEYSVPVGSDSPTEIVQSSGGTWGNDSGVSCLRIVPSKTARVSSTTVYYDLSIGTTLYGSDTFPLYAGISFDSPFFVTTYGSYLYIGVPAPSSGRAFRFAMNGSSPIPFGNSSFNNYGWAGITIGSGETFDIPESSVSPASFDVSQFVSSGGVASLGVTLAQAVADVVGQAKEDDAVVIGVGASAGATAQDIADMVAQGVKAQTLDPSVSITAEAVIDTPVQPYPDIDGLGLPTLGAALVDRFPFCIPWDFVDTVRLLSADPQPINIKVDLIPQRIKTSVGITSDTSFDIDLSGERYTKIGVFCRWGSLITFCFGLFLLTKRLVWTA